jgi:hypothetical protein
MGKQRDHNGIKYTKIQKGGERYKLNKNYTIDSGITGLSIDGQFLRLSKGGAFMIRKGYRWDGPSGPAPNTTSMMRASLVHDAFYELMRKKKLSRRWRKRVDKLFRKMCIQDGLPRSTAEMGYFILRKFGKFASK